MNGLILWNGELVPAHTKLLGYDSRALRYGDGFFDTLRTLNSRPLFWDLHWQRIQSTARFLHLRLPESLTQQTFAFHISTLCDANRSPDARVRIQVMRSGEGLYQPISDEVDWMMTASPMSHPEFRLNEKGLTVGTYTTCTVPQAPIGSHKTLNALPYVLASIHAKEKGWDDVLLKDCDGSFVEASSSNIFLIRDKELLTPDLSKGGLPGTMRTQVMALARAMGYQVSVGTVTDRELKWAHEFLLTNAVTGISWVLAFGQKRYFHRQADQLVKELNRAAMLS